MAIANDTGGKTYSKQMAISKCIYDLFKLRMQFYFPACLLLFRIEVSLSYGILYLQKRKQTQKPTADKSNFLFRFIFIFDCLRFAIG